MSLLREIFELNDRRHRELVSSYREAFFMASEALTIGDGLHVRVGRGLNVVQPEEIHFLHETLNFDLEGHAYAHNQLGAGDAPIRQANQVVFFNNFDLEQSEQDDVDFNSDSDSEEDDDGQLNLGVFSMGRHWGEARPYFSPQRIAPPQHALELQFTIKVEVNWSHFEPILHAIAKTGCLAALRLAYSEFYFLVL